MSTTLDLYECAKLLTFTLTDENAGVSLFRSIFHFSPGNENKLADKGSILSFACKPPEKNMQKINRIYYQVNKH